MTQSLLKTSPVHRFTPSRLDGESPKFSHIAADRPLSLAEVIKLGVGRHLTIRMSKGPELTGELWIGVSQICPQDPTWLPAQ